MRKPNKGINVDRIDVTTMNHKHRKYIHKLSNDIIGIFCADIHLQHTSPIWRSAEPDWYEAMKRPLAELKQLQEKCQCPILCAGDIFDRWNSPPELINFALEWLPNDMVIIPGQHDLPNHNIQEIKKSAFYTLSISGGRDYNIPIDLYSNFNLYKWSFGETIQPPSFHMKNLEVALIHQYIWIEGYNYNNAPIENKLYKLKVQLKGYDVAVFGDNHKGFYTSIENTQVFNCGTLMRRKSDEMNYKPQIGLLHSNGKIETHFLDTSKDKHLLTFPNNTKVEVEGYDMTKLVKELEKLGDCGLNFENAIEMYFINHKVQKKTQQILLKAMGK